MPFDDRNRSYIINLTTETIRATMCTPDDSWQATHIILTGEWRAYSTPNEPVKMKASVASDSSNETDDSTDTGSNKCFILKFVDGHLDDDKLDHDEAWKRYTKATAKKTRGGTGSTSQKFKNYGEDDDDDEEN